jgi:hypothetical protein
MATQLIKQWVQELARKLRNEETYDDFPYGTEPIPGDQTWVKSKRQGKCESCSCKIK